MVYKWLFFFVAPYQIMKFTRNFLHGQIKDLDFLSKQVEEFRFDCNLETLEVTLEVTSLYLLSIR